MTFSLNKADEAIIKGDFLVCPKTHKKIPLLEGKIIDLLPSSNEFYEGAYLNTVNFSGKKNQFLNWLYLWSINSGYLLKSTTHISKGSKVLELGCGGGISYLGDQFSMYACDFSLSSLKVAAKNYDYCIRTDATEFLPFTDNSMDAVISSYYWEHLTTSSKKNCLMEIKRILKPGGLVIFLYDVETKNPFIEKFKAINEVAYNKYFLELDGHVGYETIQENLELFNKAGFEILENHSLQKTLIQETSVYIKLGYIDPKNILVKFLSFLSSGILLKPFIFLVRLFDSLFNFLPDSWGRIAITTLKKA